MKPALLCLATLLLLVSCPDPSPPPGSAPVLYASGYCRNEGGLAVPGYWKDGAWHPLPLGTGRTAGIAYAIDGDGVDIYTAGVQVGAAPGGGESYAFGYWRNDEWTGLPTPADFASFGSLMDLACADGTVDVMLNYTSTGGGMASGYWRGASWQALEGGAHATDTLAYSIRASGDDVYVAGLYGDGDNTFPGYWKDAVWHALPIVSSDANYDGCACQATMVGGELLCPGYFVSDDGDTIPGYWTGEQWTPLPLPSWTLGGNAFAVAAGDPICFGGVLTDKTNTPRFGYWQEGEWTTLPVEPYYDDGLRFPFTMSLVDGSPLVVSTVDAGTCLEAGCVARGAWMPFDKPVEDRDSAATDHFVE